MVDLDIGLFKVEAEICALEVERGTLRGERERGGEMM
jgi:hypothetical protein